MKRYIILTVTIMLVCSVSLFASYEEAVKLYEKKEYSASLKMVADELIIADDLKEDSPNFKLRFLAAHNHWKLGNVKSAISHFKRCMDIKKTSVDPYIDMALLLVDEKRYNDASDIVKKGLKISKSAILYYVLGRISLKRKSYWKAKELFEKANAINPEMYVSYNELGISLMHLKKYSEANTAFSVATAIKKNNPELINNLSLSLEKLGKYKEAYKEIQKANSLDEENKTILENMQRIKKKLKD